MVQEEEEDETLIAAPLPGMPARARPVSRSPAPQEAMLDEAATLMAAPLPPRPQVRPAAERLPALQGFTPVDRTLEMPKVVVPPLAHPRAVPVAEEQAPFVSFAPSVMPKAAPPEYLPPGVVRFLLACGVLTLAGLLVLIYLQLSR